MMNPEKKYKPLLAVTMGDPAGIGPEIALKTIPAQRIREICRPVLIGNYEIIRRTEDMLKSGTRLSVIERVNEADFQHNIVNIIDVSSPDVHKIGYGEISAAAGDIAFRVVTTAIDLALDGQVDGTVTGPINKEAINLAGHHFSGHTEIYAHFTQSTKPAMLLADENLRVIHVTTHVSLKQACDLVIMERVLDVIKLAHHELKNLGIDHPRIGVAGLNPHAGDGGLFGDEEIREIIPAIEKAREQGILADGPVPPDTLFAMARGGKYDVCVAMYHDQGHIPFKLLGFDWDEKNKNMKSVKGVNVTLGLPIIRTSVDHGTAFEIAGKGVASPGALMNAIEYAVTLCNNKINKKTF
ncbi:MAG: 4-hydroxythreonine-4-phosphate dehydrogenase PdxA [Bacteroidales bacterium]